jgi:hypothetical protein
MNIQLPIKMAHGTYTLHVETQEAGCSLAVTDGSVLVLSWAPCSYYWLSDHGVLFLSDGSFVGALEPDDAELLRKVWLGEHVTVYHITVNGSATLCGSDGSRIHEHYAHWRLPVDEYWCPICKAITTNQQEAWSDHMSWA